MSEITLDEWLSEFERLQAQSNNDEGLTTRELSELLGLGAESVRKRLRTVPEGRLVSGFKTIKGIDGKAQKVACYRILPEQGERK